MYRVGPKLEQNESCVDPTRRSRPSSAGVVRRLLAHLDPVTPERRLQLDERLANLPPELRRDNQLVGRHWTHCGYTLGPAYCSFGCSHCYLPKSANRQPLTPLSEMKAQIDAQRRLTGPGGNLQITGGDVVDAYWRAGRPDELIEIMRYATSRGLTPMLMTHGQILFDHPEYLHRLVQEGRLRKLSVHIDITMAGRPGYPIRQLNREGQLNSLRDRLVKLVQETRRTTGRKLVSALTVTACSRNIESLHEIIDWLFSRPENMDCCRTLSFQTEAGVGRTRTAEDVVTPEAVWQSVCRATGKPLPRDHLLVGHPDCSSIASLLVRPLDRRVVSADSQSVEGAALWRELINTFGGIGPGALRPWRSAMDKIQVLIYRPAVIPAFARFIAAKLRQDEIDLRFLFDLISGRARGVNIVMHNFIHADDIIGNPSEAIRCRLDTCSFLGVVRQGDDWKAVSMCEMNASVRPKLYASQRVAGPNDTALNRIELGE